MTALELDLLLRLHDGDDRCGCLRHAIRYLDQHDRRTALDIIHTCLTIHPAGATYYRQSVQHASSTPVQHVRTYGRTNEEGVQLPAHITSRNAHEEQQ